MLMIVAQLCKQILHISNYRITLTAYIAISKLPVSQFRRNSYNERITGN